jgi:hypothetical protein
MSSQRYPTSSERRSVTLNPDGWEDLPCEVGPRPEPADLRVHLQPHPVLPRRAWRQADERIDPGLVLTHVHAERLEPRQRHRHRPLLRVDRLIDPQAGPAERAAGRDRSQDHPRDRRPAQRDHRAAGDRDGHDQGHRPEDAVGNGSHRGRAHGELQGRGQEEPQGREGRRQGGDHLHRGRHDQRQLRAAEHRERGDHTNGEPKKERNTMIRKTILMAMAVALVAATASAQEPRVELSGTAG